MLAKVLKRVIAGERRRAVLGEVVPDRPVATMLARLRRFEEQGRDGLIDRRLPMVGPVKVTEEMLGSLRVLALEHPTWGSQALADALNRLYGTSIAASTLRPMLARMGLARSRGRVAEPKAGSAAGEGGTATVPPAKRGEEVTELALAGAELLKAVELELGAVRHLTEATGEHLAGLPEALGEVSDDRAGRNAKGQFQAEYNRAKARSTPELGEKFGGVEARRAHKDLSKMRVVNSSFDARYQKDLALTLLPVVVETARWSSLAHWQGGHLESLVGHAYMPSTLDKYARELKLAGAWEPMAMAASAFWMGQEALETNGAALVYIDGTTKALWTHHFTKSLKVSSTGRIMPGMQTFWLHSGSGTPLVYRTFSGQAGLREHVLELLESVDVALGEGNIQRVVVIDREGHALWLFKKLDEVGWKWIIPLCSNVTGPNARFEELGDWHPYGTEGDELQEGWLVLNDAEDRREGYRTRVIARKRCRTGNIAWYATSCASDELDAAKVLDHYFNRWPLQEQVFRAGNGRVGLDVHHGYGKTQITQIGVVTELEKLAGQLQKCAAGLEEACTRLQALAQERDDWASAAADLVVLRDDHAAEMRHQIEQGASGSELASLYADLSTHQRWLDEATAALKEATEGHSSWSAKVTKLSERQSRLEARRAKREKSQHIFTVDTELDQIMTSYKMTFMNLAAHLMKEHLQVQMELDTLIRSVLTLPGVRVRTPTTETIRVYRQPRDERAMAAVERACESLTARELTRAGRKVRFELADKLVAA